MKALENLHARTKPYARDIAWASWYYMLSTAFLLLAAVGGTLLPLPWYLRFFFSVLTGLLSVRLFVIYHDHQHRAILPKSRAADIIMRAFGIWALCPSSIWRSSHDHHHAHNSRLRGSQIGSYPIMTAEQYQKTPPGERFRYLFLRHPLTILLGYLSIFIYGMVVNPFVTSPRKHFDCLLAFLLHLTIATLLVVYFGWLALLLTLVLPFLIACALGSYLFYIQHNFPGVSFEDKAGWTFEKAALESSSHLKTNFLMRWFTGNIGYHHIHHLNHRVPFYRLPELYRDIPELREAKTVTLSPLAIIRCLRLKVWDVQKQRMIGVRGL